MPDKFRLAIAGAGNGGCALLKVLDNDDDLIVVGMSDVRADAPGFEMAKARNIPVFQQIESLPDCDVVINVTGSPEVSEQLQSHFDATTEITEGRAAYFFYDQIRKRNSEKEQIERMLDEFEKLNRVSRWLNTSDSLEQMLKVVLREAMQVTGSPAGTISLYDKTSRSLSLQTAAGFSDNFRQQEPWVIREGGLTEQIFEERQPFVINDVENSQSFNLNPLLAQEGVKALVALPLALGNETVGILYVNDFTARVYDENQVRMLDMLANQAVHAIQKARLFETIEQEKRELESLNEHLESRVLERTSDLTKSNEELVRANKAKSQFLSNMSHELRTPLTSINGFSEFLMDGFAGGLNQAQQKYLKNINIAGKHLLELINGILDLSKIEAGKMNLRFEQVNIENLLNEIVLVLKGFADKSNIALKLDYDASIPDVYLDRTKFKQVLYNLCSNAIKFSPEGSEVCIGVSFDNASFYSGEEEDYATLNVAVRDRGIGIAPEDQSMIFNPFEQADGTHSRNFQGTGLGLTLTKRLVEMHGGHIGLESRPGEGSCFTVCLPVQTSLTEAVAEIEQPAGIVHSAAIENSKPLPVAADAPLILVVDDDPHSLEVSTLYLSSAGYRVCHAMNGNDALSVARKKRPFLILLDVMMPGKDGWEVLQELKLDAETTDIPVMMCTVSENEELSLALGATDYLSKPIDRDMLANKLKTLGKGIHQKHRTMHVLAIDDEEAVRELYVATLQAQGYHIEIAADGQQGLQLAEESEPDIIILDLMMPGMDGFEVAEKLKRNPRTQDIPIIVVSAKDLSVAERMRLMGHIEDCVSKDTFSKEQLLNEIQQIETIYPHQAGLKDAITGLLNHRYFNIRLGQELSRSQRNKQQLACVLFDLDHFDKFRDSAGEAYVHAALRKVGGFFMNNLRGSDIATRHRIDEFAMILNHTDLDGALLVAQRLKNMIESYPFPGEEGIGEAGLTACCAISIYPPDGETPEQLMQSCQNLLNQAKAHDANSLAYCEQGEVIFK